MRFLLLLAFLFIQGLGHAQPFFPGNLSYNRLMNPGTPFAQLDSNSTLTKKKWSLQKYSSLSAGLMMWKGGSATYISAPIGLQLNRTINNNFYAFAGVSIAPSIVNIRQSFANPNFKNAGSQGMYQPYQLGVYSRAELGLGYTNDARTFTITGSIGIERSTYPFAQQVNTNRNGATFIR